MNRCDMANGTHLQDAGLNWRINAFIRLSNSQVFFNYMKENE